jgi:radical SAM protein with 4Fe4S-binding SPASM domain
MGTLGVTLTGGEPMLHPNFKEFLREAKRMDFAVTVLSNLTLLDDETLQIMKEGSLTSVQVSLYSMDPSHHDAITQLPGSHKKTVEAILKLVENNIPVQISCPTMTINKGDFADVYKWAFERNIKAYTDYSIMAKFNHDTDNLENRLSPKECEKIIRDIINTDRNYQEEILADDFEQKLLTIVDNPEDKFCGVGFSSCCMVSNGDIYPCAGWQSAICGNVKHDTLHNIWKNSAQLKFLRNLRKKDIKKCLDCQNKAFCSPCLTRFANESGDPLIVPDYFCEVAKVNKEVVLEWRKENK